MAHTELFVYRIQCVFKAEHRAENKPEEHRRHTARNKNFTERRASLFPEDQTADCENQTLSQISEHDSEKKSIGDRNKSGDIYIIV